VGFRPMNEAGRCEGLQARAQFILSFVCGTRNPVSCLSPTGVANPRCMKLCLIHRAFFVFRISTCFPGLYQDILYKLGSRERVYFGNWLQIPSSASHIQLFVPERRREYSPGLPAKGGLSSRRDGVRIAPGKRSAAR
jgi:hypothetical protein